MHFFRQVNMLLMLLFLVLMVSMPSEARRHHKQVSNTKTKARSISPETYDKLELFSHYAAASYCPGNSELADQIVSKPLVCDTARAPCGLVSETNTTEVYEFKNVGKYDVTGNVALDHDRHITVLSIVGKISHGDELSDENTDSSGLPVHAQNALVEAEWAPCIGCMVSQFSNDAWKSIEKMLGPVLHSRKYPKLVVTGHGKGGSIATAAAMYARNHNITTDLYTYGAPRVGNENFAKYLSFLPGKNYRVTHMYADASRHPPMNVDFRHMAPEYYVRTISESEYPQLSQIEELQGMENLNGNGGDKMTGGGPLNRWFFGQINRCDHSAHQDKFGWIGNRTEGPYGKKQPPGPENV